MNWASPKRRAFAEANNHACYWCNLAVNLKLGPEHPNAPTKEHLTPRALKKKGETTQRVLAHRICNEMRACMEAAAFKRLMQGEAVTKYDLWPHRFLRKEFHAKA